MIHPSHLLALSAAELIASHVRLALHPEAADRRAIRAWATAE